MTPANDNPRIATSGQRANGERLFAIGSGVVVVVALLSGLAIGDSPWAARDKRIDQQTVQHLASLNNAVTAYHRANGKLPAALDDLYASPPTTPVGVPMASLGAYGYRTLEGPRDFELCADFLKANNEAGDYFGQTWTHDAGRRCFALKAPEK